MMNLNIKFKENLYNLSDYKKEFPFFDNNREIIYFDNASTSQKPFEVISAYTDYVSNFNSNSGRGVYKTAIHTDKLVDEVRAKVASFIGCEDEEVFFTSGATQSLNNTAWQCGINFLKDGDQVLYCPADHKSLNQPWIELVEHFCRLNIKISLVPYKLNQEGYIDLDYLKTLISNKTKIINISHVNNTAGVVNDLREIRELVGDDIYLNVDITQSICHEEINLCKIPIEFASFSGHKIFSANGIGVLYVSKKLHQYIKSFYAASSKYYDVKSILERGTLNIASIVSLGAAIDYILVKTKEKLHRLSLDTYRYFISKLLAKPDFNSRYLINLNKLDKYVGICSFSYSYYNSNDVAEFLALSDICVRSGSHCTGLDDSWLRVSFQFYNTKDEVDTFFDVLNLHKVNLC